MANVFPKWLRRATVLARDRVRRLMRRWAGPEPEYESQRELIDRARRNPAVTISAKVVELPSQASGGSFVKPSILILQLAHIGDFVLSLRAAKKIRDGFPGSAITLVCATWNVDWAKGTGLFDRVVAFDFFSRLNQHWNGPNPDILQRFEALGLGAFDIALDLRHDADTRPCLYRVKAQVRAGYVAPVEAGYPALDLMLPAAEGLRLSNGETYSLHAEMRLELLADAVIDAYGEQDRAHPVSLLAGVAATPARPFVVLAVGAGDSIRRWPEAQFVKLGRRLIERLDFDALVVGGGAEREIVAAIVAALPPARAAAGLDLPLVELAARVAGASAVVGLGSGVTHLAATLGVPTVALLSGVSPLDVWRPIGARVVSLTGQTPCSPCGLKDEKDCPFGVACLRSITPDHALAAIERLLRERSRDRSRAESVSPGDVVRPL